jgi:hypothetical protein
MFSSRTPNNSPISCTRNKRLSKADEIQAAINLLENRQPNKIQADEIPMSSLRQQEVQKRALSLLLSHVLC